MPGQGPHGRKNEVAGSVGDSKGSGVLSSGIHIPSLDGGAAAANKGSVDPEATARVPTSEYC